MENKNGMQDVSSFLLVEGSADSEADDGLLKLSQDAAIAGDVDDDDDAESCSYDTSDTVEFHEGFYCDDEQDLCDFRDGKDNKRNGGVPSWSRCRLWLRDAALEYMDTEEEEVESKIGNGVHLSRQVMDQMDDRLFWETCMEVGYP